MTSKFNKVVEDTAIVEGLLGSLEPSHVKTLLTTLPDRIQGLVTARANKIFERREAKEPQQNEAKRIMSDIRTAVAAADDRRRQDLLLSPNDSSFLEKDWSFASPLLPVTIGLPQDLFITHSPDETMRPLKLVMNVPTENMFFIDRLTITNQLVLKGPLDACVYGRITEQDKSANCTHCGAPRAAPHDAVCRHCAVAYPSGSKEYGKSIASPTIRPSQKFSMVLRYTGQCPPGYMNGDRFQLSVSFVGPVLREYARPIPECRSIVKDYEDDEILKWAARQK